LVIDPDNNNNNDDDDWRSKSRGKTQGQQLRELGLLSEPSTVSYVSQRMKQTERPEKHTKQTIKREDDNGGMMFSSGLSRAGD